MLSGKEVIVKEGCWCCLSSVWSEVLVSSCSLIWAQRNIHSLKGLHCVWEMRQSWPFWRRTSTEKNPSNADRGSERMRDSEVEKMLWERRSERKVTFTTRWTLEVKLKSPWNHLFMEYCSYSKWFIVIIVLNSRSSDLNQNNFLSVWSECLLKLDSSFCCNKVTQSPHGCSRVFLTHSHSFWERTDLFLKEQSLSEVAFTSPVNPASSVLFNEAVHVTF